MEAVFGIIALACLAGIIKPYFKGATRGGFAAGLIASIILMAVIGAARKDHAAQPEIAAATTTGAPASGPEQPVTPISPWRYSSDHDQMRNVTTDYAQVDSTNSFEFDFPYQGGSNATITLRKKGKASTEIIFGLSKGQLLCRSYTDSYLSVKFDDGPVRTFRCTDSTTGESNIGFIQGEAAFMKGLRAAKHVMIEAEVYQEGKRQFAFNTVGLSWD